MSKIWFQPLGTNSLRTLYQHFRENPYIVYDLFGGLAKIFDRIQVLFMFANFKIHTSPTFCIVNLRHVFGQKIFTEISILPKNKSKHFPQTNYSS